MRIDGRPVGDVLLLPGAAPRDFRVQADALLDLLRPRLSDEGLAELEARSETFDDKRVLTAEALRASGLAPVFDETALELRLSIPVARSRANVVFLGYRGTAPDVPESLPPSRFSGFVNARASQDMNFNFDPSINGRQPLRSDLDGALNYGDWVFEGAGSYAEKTANDWTRGDLRVVRDFPNAMTRVAAGDLSYPVSTYQRFRAMGGVTVASNFSLQPYRITIPMSNTEIYLKTPSRVVVFVNGARLQTLDLPAGRHDLRNLSLGNGINDIRLEITDQLGRTESVYLPWVSDSDQLAHGIHQFAYSAGFPSFQQGSTKKYDTHLPTGSFFHRYGFTNQATAGAFYQGDKRQFVTGLEALYATLWGTFGLEPALSRLSGNKLNGAARFRYSLTDYRGPDRTQRNLALGAEYRQAGFAPLDDFTGSSATQAYDLNATYGQTLFWNVSGRVTFSYQFNRETRASLYDSYASSLSLIRGFDNGLQLTVTGTDRRNITGLKERGVFALVSWSIPETNHYITASTDTMRDMSRLDWRYSSARLVGGVSAQAGVERSPGLTRGDSTIEYTGNRGTVDLVNSTSANQATRTTHTTSLRMGTALVFAGGKLAVGRPITDSFAIVAPIRNLKGQTIDVNPNSFEYYDARADWLGPGVVTNMRPYQYFQLYFDPSKLDPGFELDQENHYLKPTYKSGTLVRVGTESRLMLSGTLRDARGKPIELEAGEARHLDDTAFKAITLFTNRKGKFKMTGFKPGRYVLKLFNDRYRSLTFEIPANSRGVYDIGSLTAPEENQ